MQRIVICAIAAIAAFTALIGVSASTSAPAAGAAATPVTVSLTFDDGTADQTAAGTALQSHGMKGTFYIISGRVGSSGYLSLPDIQTLAANGNEIGDHTVSHLNLTTVSNDEAARQVCNARVQLMNWGFHIWDFAYPQGGTNSGLEQIVRNCNLNSARIVGNVVSPGTCDGCPYSENIPPRDPYAIATPDSIKSNWTLNDIKGLVTQAQQHGGGWVPIVFHKICAGCDVDSTSPAIFNSFLDWLQTQQTNGVTIKTVHDVVGGAELPPVTGPVANPNPGALIQNASLENDQNGDGVPDCWTVGGSGTNTFTSGISNDEHTGSFAEKISISSFSSGDRRLQTAQDLGQCAPPATPGDSYTASAFLKGSGTYRWVSYYRTEQGAWVYWTQSPVISPSSSYVQSSWKTPAVPAGATALSVGISLRSTGSFTADDFALADNSTGDHTAPVVAITAPAANASVTGTVPITATATDNVGITSVRFFLDGVSLGSKTAATPAGSSTYKWNWDTTAVAPGSHVLTTVATDTSGNTTTSAPVTVTTGTDSTAPVTTLKCNSKATCAATYNAPVTITLTATDNVAVAHTYYTTDGSDPTATNGNEYTGTFTVSSSALVKYRSVDASGNLETVKSQQITIDSGKPTAVITAPADGTNVTGTVAITATATDDVAVTSVRFLLDGVSLGTKTSPTSGSSYKWNWSTTGVANGSHVLTVTATDSSGNTTTSAPVTVTIGAGDTTKPVVAITAPAGGTTVNGTVAILANATDNVGVVSVRFFLDGVSLGSKTAPTTSGGSIYKWNWSTGATTSGPHTLTAVATDAAGNQTTSAPITVSVG